MDLGWCRCRDLGEPTAAESRVTNESEVIVQSTCKWSSLLKPATMRPELFVPTSVAETTLQWKNDKHVKVKGLLALVVGGTCVLHLYDCC